MPDRLKAGQRTLDPLIGVRIPVGQQAAMKKQNFLDYIEFPAIDIEATKAFYTSAFGWKFTDYGPDYVSFTDGNFEGGFTTESKPQKPGGPLIILYSENLEGTVKVIEQSGGIITKHIYKFPGGRRFHFEDPNGNELAVWSEN